MPLRATGTAPDTDVLVGRFARSGERLLVRATKAEASPLMEVVYRVLVGLTVDERVLTAVTASRHRLVDARQNHRAGDRAAVQGSARAR